MYTQYLKKKYDNPVVVFDGYETEPTIKDAAHIRRTNKVSRTVLFQPDMIFNGKKKSSLPMKIISRGSYIF